MSTLEQKVDMIFDSYNKYELTSRIDSDNIVSRDELIFIVKELRKLLFFFFFDNVKVRSEYVKYHIGEKIELIEYKLSKQIKRALDNCEECGLSTEELDLKASETAGAFMERIPKIRDYLYTDVQAAYNGDPAAYSTQEIIYCYPGIFAITVYRIAHELWELKVPMIPRIISEYAHNLTGIDIHPGATIGEYFFIDHGTGIVIGETTIIGKNVKIYQGVTLGGLSTRKGQLLKGVKRHPTIGDNVTIYSNSSILGGETVIGNDVIIGGNTFIVSSVAAGMKVNTRSPQLEYSVDSAKYNSEYSDWII